MNDRSHAKSAEPWSHPVAVAKIPEGGLHVTFSADVAQREALRTIGGLRSVQDVTAQFDLALGRGAAVQVSGRVKARVGQDCVVTLEPLENHIDEEVDIVFAEPDTAEAAKPRAEGDEEEPDMPELIENGVIDLGKLAADMFFLGIDPYPRKPGVVFEAEQEGGEPEDHPFAALKALKQPK